MFLTDLKREFYDLVRHQRVLVLVACDVDALCACKILQYLFQCDHVSYTIIPVNGKKELENAYNEYSEQIQFVVLINCGANFNVVELLQPKEECTIFIADNHYPVDVYNVYNGRQVKLLMNADEAEEIPAFEDVFREDDDSDEESKEDDETEETSSKRRRFDEQTIERRRERRLWEESRKKILFDYSQFAYYGSSTAALMFDLAWKMSRDNNDILWWAIVGITEQYVNGKVEHNKYIMSCSSVQGHVIRHNHRDEDDTISIDCMKISFDKELLLALYRHWSVYESLKHTMYTACKFKLWTMKGEKKLYEFLADLGLPLMQAKQKFLSMDIQLRENMKSWIEEKTQKYGLDKILGGTFIAQYGYCHKFCAMDVVYATSSLLENADKDKPAVECFHEALDSLSRNNVNKLMRGLDMAKKRLSAIFQQVQIFLETSQIISAGPFLYAVISEGAPDSKLFSQQGCLNNLTRFLLHAQVTIMRKRTLNLPLLLSAPYSKEEGTSLIIGIPPLAEDSLKNFFGTAFEEAARRTNSRVIMDSFDTSYIQINNEDRSKFFDFLITLLN